MLVIFSCKILYRLFAQWYYFNVVDGEIAQCEKIEKGA